MKGKRIAVIGAGLAGLTAARDLRARGASVRVFEREGRVGGRVAFDEIDGYRVEPAAQLVGSAYRTVHALVESLGMRASLVPMAGRDALWRGGRMHEVVYGSHTSMAASGGLPMATKLRLGARYLPFLKRHAAALDLSAPELAARAGLDSESIADWGRREIGEAFVDALVYPQLAAYYGALPEQTSAAFYHLLAKQGLDVSLVAVSGGIGEIAEALATRVRELGGEVTTGCEVREVRVRGDGVDVVHEEGEEAFDGAVSAIPAPLLRQAAPDLAPELTDWLAGVRYRPALTMALALDRPAGVRYFGASFPRGASRTVAAVTVQENKAAGLVPSGRGLLVVFATPDAAEQLFDRPSREVLDAILPDVDRILPGVAARVVRARAYRWEQGSPVFYPGYLGRLGQLRQMLAGEVGPLALAGDYLYGASLEAAVRSGHEAADYLARRTP